MATVVSPIEAHPPTQRAPIQRALLDDRRNTLQLLAKQVQSIERSGRNAAVERRISSGCREIDHCLPEGGYLSGSLVEWLCDGSGTGAQSLALHVAKQAMEGGKYLLVVDRGRRFYPLAAVSLGLPLDRIIVVQPQQESDALWSIDQGLRSTAVGAVLAQVDRLDDRDARRLQLAAEQGGGLGLLTRQARTAQGVPSWAEVQWHVQPRPVQAFSGGEAKNGRGEKYANVRALDLKLLRCRGGRPGARLSLIMDGDRGGILRWDDRVKNPFTDMTRTEGFRYASQSALCLATELAMPTHASTRPVAHRAPVRVAGA